MTHDPDRAAAISSEKGNSAEATRRPWWHLAMLHPTLPVALIPVVIGAVGYIAGSIPQILQWKAARDLNVPVSEVSLAQEQARAWADNLECLRTDIQQISLRSPANYTVSLQSCPSGDILLALTPLHAPSTPIYQWVVTRKMFKPQASAFLVNMALAQTVPPSSSAPVLVIDVRTQGRNVVRRLQLSDKTCIDEVVDPATGRRVSSQSAPCTRF
jgi:hypothetical protein